MALSFLTWAGTVSAADDCYSLDADDNTQLLNRKLDDKISTIKMKLQKNEDVTVVFIHN